MSMQRALLRALSSGVLNGMGDFFLKRHIWTVEGGEAAGLRLHLPQNREYIFGTSEVAVQETLGRYLRPGGVFYDVGANVGFFTLIAARMVGPEGRAYAFDPVAENIETVQKNALLNGFGNVRAFEVAAGRSAGVAEFLMTHWDGGGTLSSSAVRPTEPQSRRSVQVVTLDDLIASQHLERPTLVKVDVEGVELDVLEGMARTIAAAMPVVLCEIDDGDRESFLRRWQQLDDRLMSFGYSVSHLRSSYPNTNWFVGHSLAVPPSTGGTS